MPDERGLGRTGFTFIPPADGREYPEFEKRLADLLAVADKLERENERLEREHSNFVSVMEVTRTGRLISRTWRAWSTFCGIAAIVVSLSWAALFLISGDQEVVVPLTQALPESIQVHEGGLLSFTQDVDRKESCPGDVVEIFTPVGGGEVITQRRPVQHPEVRVWHNARVTTQLPVSMPDGRWRYTFGIDSRCPLRRRFDPLANFDIEVRP